MSYIRGFTVQCNDIIIWSILPDIPLSRCPKAHLWGRYGVSCESSKSGCCQWIAVIHCSVIFNRIIMTPDCSGKCWLLWSYCLVQSHYLNQCRLYCQCTLKNKIQWNLEENSNILIHENAFQNNACKMVSILSRTQCVNFWYCSIIFLTVPAWCWPSCLFFSRCRPGEATCSSSTSSPSTCWRWWPPDASLIGSTSHSAQWVTLGAEFCITTAVLCLGSVRF